MKTLATMLLLAMLSGCSWDIPVTVIMVRKNDDPKRHKFGHCHEEFFSVVEVQDKAGWMAPDKGIRMQRCGKLGDVGETFKIRFTN